MYTNTGEHTHTHTHTYIYIYIYRYSVAMSVIETHVLVSVFHFVVLNLILTSSSPFHFLS